MEILNNTASSFRSIKVDEGIVTVYLKLPVVKDDDNLFYMRPEFNKSNHTLDLVIKIKDNKILSYQLFSPGDLDKGTHGFLNRSTIKHIAEDSNPSNGFDIKNIIEVKADGNCILINYPSVSLEKIKKLMRD